MKLISRWLRIWPCALLAIPLLTGCTSFDKLLFKQEVVTTPASIIKTNTVFQTNTITVVESKTNAVTGQITPPQLAQVVTPVITYDYAPAVTVTNLVPNSAIQGGIAATGALPIPFAGAIALGLGWAYSFYASVKNKKVAAGIVMSVQRAREFLQTTTEGQAIDTKIKDILASHQDASGITEEVNKLLARYVDKK